MLLHVVEEVDDDPLHASLVEHHRRRVHVRSDPHGHIRARLRATAWRTSRRGALLRLHRLGARLHAVQLEERFDELLEPRDLRNHQIGSSTGPGESSSRFESKTDAAVERVVNGDRSS